MPPPFRRQLWTCKYCNVTINDDAPSRRLHETGMRHKANVQKAIGEQYHRAADTKRQADEQAREMARIEAEARKAVGDYRSTGSSLDPPTRKEAKKPTGKAAYGSLFQDQLVRRQARAERGEQEVEEHIQLGEAGVPGEWEFVSTSDPAPRSKARPSAQLGGAGVRSLKPSARSALAEPSERSEARSFGLMEKRMAVDDLDEEDFSILGRRGTAALPYDATRASINATPLVRPSQRSKTETGVKQEATSEHENTPNAKQEDVQNQPGAEEHVQDPGVEVEGGEHTSIPVKVSPGALPEAHPGTSFSESGVAQRLEPNSQPQPQSSGGGLFKKRKAGTGKGTKKIVV